MAFFRASSAETDGARVAAELSEQLPSDTSALLVFASNLDEALAQALASRFPAAQIIGASTAGEIGPAGYVHGSVAALAFTNTLVRTRLVSSLEGGHALTGARDAADALLRELDTPSFGLMLCDGLSGMEELVVAGAARAWRGLGFVGGSAGDERRFVGTKIMHGGHVHDDAAVLALVSVPGTFHLFKHEHFEAGSEALVVTDARPAERLVLTLNGRPAAQEYARAAGVEANGPLALHAHPAVVRMGPRHYVRAAMKVLEGGGIQFASAIEVGVVLSVGRSTGHIPSLQNLTRELEAALGQVDATLCFDCVGRLAEIDQLGVRPEAAALLERIKGLGFASYGEQWNGMHVNQTLTGVALRAPTP